MAAPAAVSQKLWPNQLLRQHHCPKALLTIRPYHVSTYNQWLGRASGVLSGKPTTTGTYSFAVKVTDGLGNTATQSLSIKIN
jgi:hypothetical protein